MAKTKALDDMLARLDDIEKWAKQGETHEAIASKFGISRSTFYEYLKQTPDISDAPKKGGHKFVKTIKSKLAKKAKGFNYTETVTEVLYDSEGDKVYEKTKTHHKYSPPDTAAANLLLKNYDKEEWANDPQLLELKKQELEVKKQQGAENAEELNKVTELLTEIKNQAEDNNDTKSEAE